MSRRRNEARKAARARAGGGREIVLTTPTAAPGQQGEDWFGPGRPLQPFAPPSVAGRRFDYQFGQNMQVRPRWDQQISFSHLRALADGHDLTRLAIETRKDQMSRLEWTFGVVDSDEDMNTEQLGRAAGFRRMLRRPDGENFWVDWLRMLLEDMLVIDAPAVYIQRTMDGEDVIGLHQIDGATILPIIDSHGRTPRHPEPAYQQVLHGMPAVDYTSQSMVYRPRNRRVHTVWGFSPVEQIIATVNIALRRQIWQHSYFTNGNIPDSLIGVPSTWSPDQIRDFQDWFDALLTGATERRRGAIFVPGEVAKSYVPTKDAEMFGQAEEWLARVVCYAFSIPHQALVKEVNRATADNAREQAMEDGLAPVMGWVKSLVDGILIDHLGETELEFRWADDKELDPKVLDEIWAGRIDRGVAARNEWRIDVGLEPRPEPEADMLTTSGLLSATPFAVEDGAGDDAPPTDGTDPAAPGAAPGAAGASVQAQALNGAQVQALVEMVQQTIARELSTDTAVILISIAFPAVAEERIRALVTAASHQPPPPPPPPAPPGGPPGGPPGASSDGQDQSSGGVVATEGTDGGAAGKAASSSTATGEVADQGTGPFSEAGAPVSKADRRRASALRRLSAERPLVERARRTLQGVLERGLKRIGSRVVAAVRTHLEQVRRAAVDDAEDIIQVALGAIGNLEFLIDATAETLERIAEDTTRSALAMIGASLPDDLVEQVSERAVEAARQRAAELVGKRILQNGDIVDNPDARWAITDSTRDMIRDTITRVLAENEGSDVIIQELQDAHAFSPARAEMVSRTEVGGANSQAAMESYRAARQAGVSVLKEWAIGSESCEVCQENADAGAIGLEDDFPSGDSEPPAHPNCVCAVVPVVGEDEGGGE